MNISKVTAVVLAGGGSVRMGENKALLKLGSKTIIERVVGSLQSVFNHVLVVTNKPEEYHMLEGVKFINDCVNTEKKSSLIGLYSGLKQSKTSHIFVVACDMPFINIDLIEYMVNSLKDEDVIVPFIEGYYQPLYAIYGKACIPELEKLLEKNMHKITKFFKNVKVKKIMENDIKNFDPQMVCFENINTKKEYLQVKNTFE